mmetsp:Transcript_6009/g.17544  ORF Transcript_6009/g.17544 Transcript_6009/m.17544 type:complete len:209 (+) Transcript_6009:1786-2412(+)
MRECGARRTASVSWPPSSYPIYPGGGPVRRLTECFSMYSDISMRTISFSFPKYVSARALHNSVLPTPVGPANRKLATGRVLSLKPDLALRTALDTDRTALPCPLTLWVNSPSNTRRRSVSSVSNLPTGTDVHRDTTSATVCSVTLGQSSSFVDVPPPMAFVSNGASICTTAPASSNRSRALSGRNRSVTYRSLNFAAASRLSGVYRTS